MLGKIIIVKVTALNRFTLCGIFEDMALLHTPDNEVQILSGMGGLLMDRVAAEW